MEKFVVIDLETTGHSAVKGDKIIEVGIVVIEKGAITKEFSTFLNPGKEIPSFISNLTSITNQDVAEAPMFAEVAEEIVSYFQSGYLIAHNVPFDLGFLNQELKMAGLPALRNPVLDTVELARVLYPQAPSYKLGELAALLDITHDKPHRAVSDAYVTAKLLLRLKEKLELLPYETIEHLLKLEKTFKSDLSELLRKRQNDLLFSTSDDFDVYRGIALKRINETGESYFEEQVLPPFGEYLDDVYEENGYLEKMLTNFEKRSGQREMSETIFDAFQTGRHALIEAGTGTGKSLAYLIPAIFEAIKHNKRIVISTYTTQLQTQLMEEDIPLVKTILPFTFSAALLKGKQHFISLERLEEELLADEYNYDIALTKAMILVWLTETVTGDIDELHLPTSGKYFAGNISAESEGQSDQSSSWTNKSFYQRAKNKAIKADIVITNHALLCTDMYHEYQFLPSYDHLIIDEAHHLEETASKRYGLKLDYVHMLYELNKIGAATEDKWLASLLDEFTELADLEAIRRWDGQFEATKHEIDDLFRMIFQYVSSQNKSDKSLSDIGRIQYRLLSEDDKNSAWQIIQEMAGRLLSLLRDLGEILQEIERNIDPDKKDDHCTIKE
ncbi:exonuclease domain-containing protein [Virgibacillus halophilus]|uniref:Exonuclease domain-containing protein n=1 Tax=Tigheibacillus halophilus TaxID=361280 RepID=A0ABU5CC41_9BACI|nr:exonuclease domain-containing protein [Virgibacillus halophilus]